MKLYTICDVEFDLSMRTDIRSSFVLLKISVSQDILRVRIV
jgi:hypothetical protein